MVPHLTSHLQEVITNPFTASQAGLLTTAYAITALEPLVSNQLGPTATASLSKANIPKEALIAAPKPSYLLNPRLYGKLNAGLEQRMFLRAIVNIVVHLDQEGVQSTSILAWSQALIFCIVSGTIEARVRREASEALTKLYQRKPSLIGGIVIKGLWQWWESLEAGEKDSAASLAKNERTNIHLVIRSICVPSTTAAISKLSEPEQTIVENQMTSLLVLAQQTLIPRVDWIELCLRVGVDPGQLTKSHIREMINQVISLTETDTASRSQTLCEAGYSSVAQLAFVSPESIPHIMEFVSEDLDIQILSDIGAFETAVFRAPAGTPFLDVLAKKTPSGANNRNDKDFATLQWEENLRAQIAQKKGQQVKISAEDNAKIQAQLEKEATIRSRVQQARIKILRGIGIINSLAVGPPVDAGLWIGPAVHHLLNIIRADSGNLADSKAHQAYLRCSGKVSPRVGNVKDQIGVATLRLLDVKNLPENLMEGSLDALTVRVLYRLRFCAEQRPLDSTSLIYSLPLVILVLNGGGSGSTEDAETQIILALEFLSLHTDACADNRLPRGQVLQCLIDSLQKYGQHWKLIKDCLMDLCRCIAPNITKRETAILLKGTLSVQGTVRTTVLQSISASLDMSDVGYPEEIWLAAHDDIEENIELAWEILHEIGTEPTSELLLQIMPYLEEPDQPLRRAAARSVADLVQRHPAKFGDVLNTLQTEYQRLAKPRQPELDAYGMPKKLDLSDPWEARHGIALAFMELAPIFDVAMLSSMVRFLIDQGPVADVNPAVRAAMVDAAIAIITARAKDKVEPLMKAFEQTLETPNDGSENADRVNEAVIIMYGALAAHLLPGEPRIPKVIDRLLDTLTIPSETVQYAVAECLPALVRAYPQKTSDFVQRLLEQLLNSATYASRRGAAYGLAGLVHGKGISSIREFRIIQSLKGAADNKKDHKQREGSLLGFELLATVLGRVFEPYVIQIVPQLLSSFGDPNADVRDACLAASKACFGILSSYGVKEILPTLLSGLDDDQWRSKKGACDLLGAMAYLEPQELAHSLPQIIPPLSAVLNDSHKEVRLASNRSLKRFGEVISNPEIKSLVDILLKALMDPTKFTDEALDSLIKVQFVHYLDSPSLALIVRILQRGLGDRSVTKRKSAQVIGSLAHLTERKDLISHLPILVAGLKSAVVDPVPTTRATAAKALGALVEKLSEDALPDLIPELMQTLKTENGAGDRLGAAQALSEVLAGLGTTRLEETLPTILQNVASAKANVREGFMSLFIFLPVCFGNSFASYLSRIIPAILSGLSDDVESIRETALRAGRLLVKNFATKAVDLLLPELERGLADDSYRIRLSSVELVGDLLFNLTGISASTEQDEVEETAQEASASLVEALGVDKRNQVLSSLYICRCDTSGLVRTAAVNVWKALVAGPRVLKELIPTLTQLIIRRLGSTNMEQKVMAGNALGEVIRKAGDTVLASLLPTLEQGLQSSTDIDAKQGICIALKELISSASEEALDEHETTLIAVVRAGLIDSNADVRSAAADAFDSMQSIFGKKAVDQVLPHLLNLLRTESAENALLALLTLLTETTRSNIILPNLIPSLIAYPISSFNSKALASLSTVAGPAMTRRLPVIMNSLMDNIVECKDVELQADLNSSFDTVMMSIDPFDGLNASMSVLLAMSRHDDHRRRAAADTHLATFFATTSVDYSRYHQDLIRALLISFDDRDIEVVKAAWTALHELTKHLKKEEMETLVFSTRQILQNVGVAGSDLPGFGLPKGLNAILPIFLQGLLNGSSEQKIQAALAIGDMCNRTSSDSLKPFVTQITGPLIRVVSERSSDVKSAILLTLNGLLEKIPTLLKPFLPQLQRTFAKCLADSGSETLRTRAAKALGTLITLTPRVDPLVNELLVGARTSDAGVRTAMLKALYEVISKAGSNMGEASRNGILSLIDTESDGKDISMAITNARLLGALIRNVAPETASTLIKHRVLGSQTSQASALNLNAVLLEAPEILTDVASGLNLPNMLRQGMLHSNVSLFIYTSEQASDFI